MAANVVPPLIVSEPARARVTVLLAVADAARVPDRQHLAGVDGIRCRQRIGPRCTQGRVIVAAIGRKRWSRWRPPVDVAWSMLRPEELRGRQSRRPDRLPPSAIDTVVSDRPARRFPFVARDAGGRSVPRAQRDHSPRRRSDRRHGRPGFVMGEPSSGSLECPLGPCVRSVVRYRKSRSTTSPQ